MAIVLLCQASWFGRAHLTNLSNTVEHFSVLSYSLYPLLINSFVPLSSIVLIVCSVSKK